MYAVRDNKYKQNIYTADADHELRIVIDGVEITPTVRTLKYSAKAISGSTLTLGHACSRYIELEIDKDIIDSLESTNEFYFEEKVTIGDSEYTTPIGYFYPESKDNTNDYYVTFKLYDKMNSLSIQVEESEFIKAGNKTRKQVLEDICSKVGLYLANDFLGCNKTITAYNDELTVKDWITFMSERACGFAQIGRVKNSNGKLPLYIKSFNNLDQETIPSNMLGEYTIGDTYTVSKISKDLINSIGNDTGIQIMLSNDNILDWDETELQEMYNQIVGMKFTKVDIQTWGDLNIDAGDIITIDTITFFAQPEMEWGNGMYGNYKLETEPYKAGTTVSKLSKLTSQKYTIKRITELENGFESVVEIVDTIAKTVKVSNEATGNPITITDASNSEPVNIKVKGKTISTLSVRGRLVDGERILTITATNDNNEKTEIAKINLSSQTLITEDGNEITDESGNQLLIRDELQLCSYNGVYDELDNEIVTKRIGKDESGNLYVLDQPEYYKVDITYGKLYKGKNKILDNSGLLPTLEIKYLYDSEINELYATKSEIEQTNEKVEMTVAEVSTYDKRILDADDKGQTALNQFGELGETYVDKDTYGRFTETVSTDYLQKKDSFEFLFKNENVIQLIDKEAKNEVDKFSIETQKYINFVNGNIFIGASNSNVMAVITPNGLYFCPNGTTENFEDNSVAFFTDTNMTIKDATVFENIKIGKFAFTPRNNGNLSFGKVEK